MLLTPDFNNILQASKALQDVELFCNDYNQTLKFANSGDFVYLDPPYVVSESRVFCEYLADSFAKPDLPRFANSLRRLDQRGVKFVVSYADTAEARRLFDVWEIHRAWTRRNIAGFASARRGGFELLATNIL